MRFNRMWALGLTLLTTLIAVVLALVLPLGNLSPRERLSTIADLLGIAWPAAAVLFPAYLIWLNRARLRHRARLISYASALVLTTFLCAYYAPLLPPSMLPAEWVSGGLFLGILATLLHFHLQKRQRVAAIVAEATAPALNNQQLQRQGAVHAADRLIESRLVQLRELCAPRHTDNTIALLAFPDRGQLLFRVHSVSTSSFAFYAAVRGLELPFFDIKAVADTYNKHVEASIGPEGRQTDHLELLRQYRNELSGSASVCAYTALRNKPFLFQHAYSRCLVCRFEFLDELNDEDRLRFQFGDIIAVPINTSKGVVAVAIVASLSGHRLSFHKHDLSVVAGGIGSTIERFATVPGLERHPAVLAIAHAIPSRASRTFVELIEHLRPDFKERVPERIIADAVHEHKTQLSDWCSTPRAPLASQVAGVLS